MPTMARLRRRVGAAAADTGAPGRSCGERGRDQASHGAGMMACMTHLAELERAALCDTLEAVGPDAPTLCDPWTTAQLAAHLVIRDRRPDLAAGVVVPALAARLEHARRDYAARTWPEMVGLVRSGPPIWSPAWLVPVNEAVNLVEFFVHHEDVLRAGAVGPQRVVSDELQAALWARLRRLARVLFRRPARVWSSWRRTTAGVPRTAPPA